MVLSLEKKSLLPRCYQQCKAKKIYWRTNWIENLYQYICNIRNQIHHRKKDISVLRTHPKWLSRRKASIINVCYLISGNYILLRHTFCIYLLFLTFSIFYNKMKKQQKTHPKKQTKTKNKQKKQQQKTTQIPQCQSSSENLIKKS